MYSTTTYKPVSSMIRFFLPCKDHIFMVQKCGETYGWWKSSLTVDFTWHGQQYHLLLIRLAGVNHLDGSGDGNPVYHFCNKDKGSQARGITINVKRDFFTTLITMLRKTKGRAALLWIGAPRINMLIRRRYSSCMPSARENYQLSWILVTSPSGE